MSLDGGLKLLFTITEKSGLWSDIGAQAPLVYYTPAKRMSSGYTGISLSVRPCFRLCTNTSFCQSAGGGITSDLVTTLCYIYLCEIQSVKSIGPCQPLNPKLFASFKAVQYLKIGLIYTLKY